MPTKGQVIYPLRWYWRADVTNCQGVVCNTRQNVPTVTPALPDPPNTATQTKLGSQPVITKN